MADEWKPRTGQKIERLYAWIATEPDGGQGVCGHEISGMGFVPLVGADKARIESLRRFAEETRRLTGYSIELVEFSGRTVLEALE